MSRRLPQLLFVLLAATAAAPPVFSQSAPATLPAAPKTADRETFKQLLFMPAPPPRTAQTEEVKREQTERPHEFYDKEKPPPDDAPIADLLDYWEQRAASLPPDQRTPSDEVRRRLLAACEAAPERLPRLLHLLPDNLEAADRVKKLYDAAQDEEHFDDKWRESVREWLRFNSRHFLSELAADARKAKDKKSYVDNEADLKALAKVDWEGAEPLLQSLSSGGQPRTAALALALLYRHAVAAADTLSEERYRSRLQVVAADRAAPARARDTAIEELSLTEWSGRDEWYLSLFADETLLEPLDGNNGFNPRNTRESDGPAVPEFYLLDAATGRTELLTGEVAPLLQEGARPLQPTSRPDEFWAAVADGKKNVTRVGRYNLRDFSFQHTLVVPHLTFDSMSMWVDETADKLYVVYEGQLLRLPLRR